MLGLVCVALVLGRHIGKTKERVGKAMKKKYMLMFKEGELVRCEGVEGRGRGEEDCLLDGVM